MSKKIMNQNKCKKIKLVLTDVDGVLTDGGRYYSQRGEVMKRFHVRDGMGVNILLRNGIKTAIITKEKSKIVEKWAKEMNVVAVYGGVVKKELELSRVCKKFHVTASKIAYIGDDVNDLELMKAVGFSATPSDGVDKAKKIADYICKHGSGKGAFREIVDLILLTKLLHSPKKWY